MTEVEWLASTDPHSLFEYVRLTASERKRWLSVVACASRIPRTISCPEIEEAVELITRLAEGRGEVRDAHAFYVAMMARASEFSPLALTDVEKAQAELAAAILGDTNSWRVWMLAYVVGMTAGTLFDEEGKKLLSVWTPELSIAVEKEHSAASEFLRDIFGNPFRPTSIDPSWRTSTVVALARGMYESRDFSPMTILSDALQDAGCDNEDILNHCRGEGPHVRGCWIVDMILAKE